jgi:hypothetical protein
LVRELALKLRFPLREVEIRKEWANIGEVLNRIIV